MGRSSIYFCLYTTFVIQISKPKRHIDIIERNSRNSKLQFLLTFSYGKNKIKLQYVTTDGNVLYTIPIHHSGCSFENSNKPDSTESVRIFLIYMAPIFCSSFTINILSLVIFAFLMECFYYLLVRPYPRNWFTLSIGIPNKLYANLSTKIK